MVLFAELLVDVLDEVHLVTRPVDVYQLQVNFLAVVHFQGPLHDGLELLRRAELALQIHEGDPQIQFVVLRRHRNLLDGSLGDAPCSLCIQVFEHEGHVLDPKVGLVVIADEHSLEVIDCLGDGAVFASHFSLLRTDRLLKLELSAQRLLARLGWFL